MEVEEEVVVVAAPVLAVVAAPVLAVEAAGVDVEEEEEEEEDIFANDCISVLVFVLMSGFPFFFFLLTLRLSSKSA